MDKSKTKQQLLLEIEELRTRLEEAEETLRAIRSGEVDALVVSGTQGEQIYTLQGADRSYRILLETMEEGAATLSNDGTILYCNRRLADMLEAPLENVTGSPIKNYLSPADWRKFGKLLEEMDGVGRGEFDLQTSGGKRMPALLSLGTLAGTGMPGFCLTAADLTEQKRVEKALRTAHAGLEERVKERTKELSEEIENRKRVEEQLREGEERFRNLVRYAPAAIYETDLQGTRFLSVNDAMCEVTKFSREELLSMKPIDLLAQESRSLFQERIRRTLAGEEIDETVEYRVRRKDGEWIYAMINAGALTYTKDKPPRVVVIAYDVTERKKIQEALRQSEERYRQLVQYAPAGIYEVDFTTGRFTEVNDVMSRILGYTKDELLAMTAFDILDDEGRARFASRIRLARSGEQPAGAAEYPVRTKDGRLIWALLNVTFRWDGDRIVGATVIAHDITERKKAEEALRESEQRWATTLASIGDAVIAADADGRITFMNPVAEELTGWPLREASRRPVPEVFHIINEHTRQTVEDPVAKVLKAGAIVGLANHTILVRKDGREVPIDDSGAPIKDPNGKTSGVVLIFRDISERRRAEEEVRKSHDELELRVRERTAEVCRQAELLELARDAILVTTLDGVITFWNKGAAEMYGWGKEEAPGKIIPDLLKAKFPMPRDKIVNELIQNGRWEGQLTQTRKDGKEMKVFSRWALQRDEEGRPAGILVINYDITQRLKLEEQLRQSQKLEAIGALTGGIAHDFNNILGAVVINSEMALLDLPVESGVRSNLDLILKAGMRGKDLVKQMLLFSRKSEPNHVVLPLTPLIKETFKLLRSSIPTTIQMKLHLETESDAVSADPSQIQQVIMNLCTNAAYAMRGTTGSIDISLQGITFGADDLPEEDMEPGDYLVFSVEDTGSGMDEEVKKRIFEPFFTTKPVGEGTGLGLSAVYGIVKNHKGRITVYSEPGKGSIFRVYLPKVDTGASVAPEAPKPIPRGNERVLLVDDEESNIRTLQNMLQHLGYKVTALMDSQEALKLFSADPSQFDLVITDQTMPFMTGEDLGKEFMRMRPDIPVILCTGYSDLVSPEKAAALGFRGYLTKPFTVREGAEIVRRLLDQKYPK